MKLLAFFHIQLFARTVLQQLSVTITFTLELPTKLNPSTLFQDSQQPEDGFTDIPKMIEEEDVDFLPYVGWATEEQPAEKSYEVVHTKCVVYSQINRLNTVTLGIF